MTRLLTATFIASVVAYAFASLDAVVYTLDATARNGQALSIGGENARLWLANRLGLSSFYSLEQADTNTLSLLNQYEDDQEPLFSPAETKSRKLVIIEGVQSPEGITPNSHRNRSSSSFSRFLRQRGGYSSFPHLESTVTIV